MMRSMSRGSILVGVVLAGMACTKGSGVPQGASNAVLGSSVGGGIALITAGLADDPTAIHLTSTMFHDKGATDYRAVPVMEYDHDGYSAGRGNARSVQYSSTIDNACGTTGSVADRIADCAALNHDSATWDGTQKGNSGQGIWKLVTHTTATQTPIQAGGRTPKQVWQDTRTGLLWSSLVSPPVTFSVTRASGETSVGGFSVSLWTSATGASYYRLIKTNAGVTMTVSPLPLTAVVPGGQANTTFDATRNVLTAQSQRVNAEGVILSSVIDEVSGATMTSDSYFANIRNLVANAPKYTYASGGLSWCEASGNSQDGGFSDDPHCGSNTTHASACAEFEEATPIGETWASDGYSASKGGMGLQAATKVAWRLPTIDDYKQADVDGIRFVLQDMGLPAPSRREWSATWNATNESSGLAEAWDFGGGQGFIESLSLWQKDSDLRTIKAGNPAVPLVNGNFARCVGKAL